VLVTAFHVTVAEDVDGGGVDGGDEVAAEMTNVTGIVVVYQVPTLIVTVPL
jgi:hypothetical protein